MEWNIYKNGNLINTIYADENFVKELCEENGWTYSQASINGISTFYYSFEKHIDQKISSIKDRQEFIEDCIAEMAMDIYKEV